MRKDMITKAVRHTNLQLRQHNSLLRKNLRRIVACSSDNEKAQERMDEMEALVYTAPSLKEMFDSVITRGRRIFEINIVTVALEKELRTFYPGEYQYGQESVFLESDNVMFLGTAEFASHFGDRAEPVLRGNLRRGTEAFFPNGKCRRIRSEALVPLGDERGVIGAVCYGSQRNDRFMEGYGSRFLTRLSRIVTLKVELFRAMGPPGKNA